jgi:hypothetical protein
MRDKGLDPFPIPEYEMPSWSKVELVEGVMEGLSSIHRTGPLLIQFEENIVRITLHLGAENLKGDKLILRNTSFTLRKLD